MVNGNNLPHELLTTREKTKLRNDMPTDIKLFKAQIS